MRPIRLLVVLLPIACADAESGRDTGVATNPTSASASGATSAAGMTSGSAGTSTSAGSMTSTTAAGEDDTGEDPKFDLAVGTGGPGGTSGQETTPVRMLPGLESITFHERTGGDAPTPYTFTVDGAELSARLADPLTDSSFDISGAQGEFYDVYYSDIDGNFELDGLYLTISGIYSTGLPAGGGLNLAEIGLNFDDDTTEFGNYVASFVILGDNAVQPDGNVENCIDGDLQTHSTMGNTLSSNDRLRITLGFLSSSGPPPA